MPTSKRHLRIYTLRKIKFTFFPLSNDESSWMWFIYGDLPQLCRDFLYFPLCGREEQIKNSHSVNYFRSCHALFSQIFVAKISCLSPASFISNHN